MIHRTPRVVRPASLGPREADNAHHVLPPQPPSAPPALDAFTLLALWRRFQMVGDVGNAARILNELQRLATRRTPRAEGEHDDAAGGEHDSIPFLFMS